MQQPTASHDHAASKTQPMVGGSTPLCGEDRTAVEKNVKQILKALELVGFSSSGFKLGPTLEHHIKCCERIGVLKFYKYKMASYIAWALDQPMPAQPQELKDFDSPEVLLGGRAMQWLKLVKRTSDSTKVNRWDTIVATLGTVKRAMERPSDQEAEKALLETFEGLTRTVKVYDKDLAEKRLWSDITDDEETELEFDELLNEVRRTTREIFEGKTFSELDTARPFVPSTNANYIVTRSDGGAVGWLMKSGILDSLKADQPLISWKEGGMGSKGSWRSRSVVVSTSNLDARWKQAYEYILDEAEKEEKSVKLVALKEALKIRVISKGPVATYTALKPLQQWLWSTLRSHDANCFRLIGEEISEKYLETQLGNLRQGEKFLSGDYKAATDNVDPRLSEEVVKTVSGLCIKSKQISKLFMESLTGHLIENPLTGALKRQTWGQLMGSITSFPILCIINAAICRRVREKELGRSLRLKDANISLNGDDCCFRCTEKGQYEWERLAKLSGMSPSIGKYFFAERFVEMNSTRFVRVAEWCERGDPSARPHVRFLEEVPRINMGLLSGQARTTSGKTEKVRVASWGTLNSVSANAHTLIRECPKEDRLRVFESYLNTNWDLLTGANRKTKKGKKIPPVCLPWFLPEHLGGLGLPTFPDHYVIKDGKSHRPYMPTDKDNRLAAAIYAHGKLPSKRPEGVNWKIWEYVQKRLRTFPKNEAIQSHYEFTHKSQFEEYELNPQASLTGRLCVEALFTLPFEKVYRESREDNLTLRKVEREVRKRMKDMSKVEPFEYGAYPRHVPHEDHPGRYITTGPQYQLKSLSQGL
jgi:elongation factor P hydroxylase